MDTCCKNVLPLADIAECSCKNISFCYDTSSGMVCCNGHLYAPSVMSVARDYFKNRQVSMYVLDEPSEVFFSLALDAITLVESEWGLLSD